MRRWLRKWLPDHETLQRKKSLRWLWLSRHPSIWHLNRRTIARGLAAGLLVAFIPFPIQFILAGILAFLFRGNLPIAVAVTLISNPFTLVPITFLIYKVGSFITQTSGDGLQQMQEQGLHWGLLGKNYLIGLIVVSISMAVIGYSLVELSWRISTWWRLRSRKKRTKR